jgi:hypothetical protein
MKQVDMSRSVYQLTEQYPELIDILKELGFLGVRNPISRKTLGRMTTVPQGCDKMGKDLSQVTQALRERGSEVKTGSS